MALFGNSATLPPSRPSGSFGLVGSIFLPKSGFHSFCSHAAWEQKEWNPDFGRKIEPTRPKLPDGREGGNVAEFPNNAIADTENDPLYQTVIWDVKAYRMKVPNGTYTVTLKFC